MRIIFALLVAGAYADQHCEEVPEGCYDFGDGGTNCAAWRTCEDDTKKMFADAPPDPMPTTCQGWLDLYKETCVDAAKAKVDDSCVDVVADDTADPPVVGVTCEMAVPQEKVDDTCVDVAADDTADPVVVGVTCELQNKQDCTDSEIQAPASCNSFGEDAGGNSMWSCVDGVDHPGISGKVGECDVGMAQKCRSFADCVDCDNVPDVCAVCEKFGPCSAALAKAATDATEDEKKAKDAACDYVGTNDDATCETCMTYNGEQPILDECKDVAADMKAMVECKTGDDAKKYPEYKDVADGECDMAAASTAGCNKYVVCIDKGDGGATDESDEEPEPVNTAVDAETQTAIEEALGDDFPKGLFNDDGTWDTKILKTLKDAQLDKICDSDKVAQEVCDNARALHKYEAPDNTSAAFIAGIGAMSFLALLL